MEFITPESLGLAEHVGNPNRYEVRPRPRLSALGQEAPVDILGVVRELHEGYQNISPITNFIGAHPFLAISSILLSILAGGAVGGYIGAGMRTM